MIIVNNINNERIVGTASGEAFSVTYSEKKYNLMKELQNKAEDATTVDELKAILEEFTPLTKESYKEIIEQACPYVVCNPHTNKFYLKYNGVVSSRPMPNEFAERLVKSAEKGIDFMPYVYMWVRYLREAEGRPAYSLQRANDFAKYVTATFCNPRTVTQLMDDFGLSREAAVKQATLPQVSVTKEGLLCTFKVSTEIRHRYDLNEDEEVVVKSRYKKSVDPDTGEVTFTEPDFAEDLLFEPAVMGERGDAFNCVSINGAFNKKGHHIRVGCRHFLDSWDQVGPPMGPGLHVGNLDYIGTYQTDQTVTHNVFVDPAHIHTVNPNGHGDGALTCIEYFVHSSFKGQNKTLYNSSEYAKFHDEEYVKYLNEVVKASAMKKEEVDQFESEAKSLIKA